MNNRLLWVLRVATVIYIAVALFLPFKYFPGGSSDIRGSIAIYYSAALILPLYPIWKWINRQVGIPEIKTPTYTEDIEANEFQLKKQRRIEDQRKKTPNQAL